MQTTLTIDDNLFAEASRLSSVQDEELLIKIALIEFIKSHSISNKMDVKELVGKVKIAPDYDYKKLRIDE